MSEEQKLIKETADQLMAALIIKGTVKPGEDTDKWNLWCIKKAINMYCDTKKYLHK